MLSHRPFPAPQPYAEQGPIFLHAEPCPRRPPSAELPAMLMSERYLIGGYSGDDRIVYGTGQIVQTGALVAAAEARLVDPRLAYIDVRSAANNCFLCPVGAGLSARLACPAPAAPWPRSPGRPPR